VQTTDDATPVKPPLSPGDIICRSASGTLRLIDEEETHMTNAAVKSLAPLLCFASLVMAVPVAGCGGGTSNKDGGGGAGGSTGGSGGAGTGGGGNSDAGSGACPAARPQPGAACNVEDTCRYAAGDCTCLDPGPDGIWECDRPPTDGGNPAACPAQIPDPGAPCTVAVQECQYGDEYCDCIPADGWTCFIQ
jgi:hypothetical protein